MKKQFCDRNTKYYIESICHQFPSLYIIYIAEYIVVIHGIFCFILKSKSLSFTCSHSLSFVFIPSTTCYHSFSFVITRYITRCHSLSLVVIRCHSLYHSLSLDVPLACLFINDHRNFWVLARSIKPLMPGGNKKVTHT